MDKTKSFLFTSLDTHEEIINYINTEGFGIEQVKDNMKKFELSYKEHRTYPVCILSHMYDAKRSKLIVRLIEEQKLKGLDRKYHIFVYEDQKSLYEQFENVNINIEYIPLKEEYMTLTGKRQYILDWNQRNNIEHAFFAEDDCFDFYLPIGAFGKTGSFRNKRFDMSLSLMFSFWEFLIKENNLTYSGPVNNMEFAFRDLSKNPFIKHLAQTVQIVHIGTKFCKERNIKFDCSAGWDDYDMIVQQCVKGNGTDGIIFSYNTHALKSGVSAMSNNLSALENRCLKNTTALIKKWGLSLIREDTKKGLYNAKINWFTIRRAIKNNVPLKEIIGKKNDEAKKFIDTYHTKEKGLDNEDW